MTEAYCLVTKKMNPREKLLAKGFYEFQITAKKKI